MSITCSPVVWNPRVRATAASAEGCLIRVLVADARADVRRGLRMWLALQPDVTVVGEAGRGDDLLDRVRQCQPDVIVLDMELADDDEAATSAAVRAIAPRCGVVLLGPRDDAALRLRAQTAGAAFICKQEPCDGLLVALRQAARQ